MESKHKVHHKEESENVCTVVVDARATRYVVMLTSYTFQNEKTYIVAVPNTTGKVSMETQNPRDIYYKLEERGMGSTDAKVVQWIVRHVILGDPIEDDQSLMNI